MDNILPYALTTLQRVKDLIWDPSDTILVTGATVTQNSTAITLGTIPGNQTLMVGMPISGTGIPSGTTIAAIISTVAGSVSLTLSAQATATNTNQTLSVVNQTTAFDNVLIRLINKSTEYIRNETGGRIFVRQTYTNDTYSINNPRQDVLQLRQGPLVSISSFQWRAGTPTNPSWTDFIGDQYEPIDPTPDPISGTIYYPSSRIRVYGVLPRIYSNMIRATYVAGYAVDWPNAGNGNSHQLPSDLTSLCESLVVRFFTRRQFAGKTSQALEGATTSWSPKLNSEDQDVIDQYKWIWW